MKCSRDGHVLFVVLAALLAVLNVLWAVIAPFVLTIPSSAAAIAGAFSLRAGLCITNGASR